MFRESARIMITTWCPAHNRNVSACFVLDICREQIRLHAVMSVLFIMRKSIVSGRTNARVLSSTCCLLTRETNNLNDSRYGHVFLVCAVVYYFVFLLLIPLLLRSPHGCGTRGVLLRSGVVSPVIMTSGIAEGPPLRVVCSF